MRHGIELQVKIQVRFVENQKSKMVISDMISSIFYITNNIDVINTYLRFIGHKIEICYQI